MSRVRRADGPTISLFPFLAVLLCTMGALLVLLVLFSRSARQPLPAVTPAEESLADEAAALEAHRVAVERVRALEQELEQDKEEISWRLAQLRDMRDRTSADLARARLQLAGVEDDARGLVDELARLEATVERLAADVPPEAGDAALVQTLEERLRDARAKLDQARRDKHAKPPAYAVVPYEGPQGTRRRPLYIECAIDGVFLQPEGIRLGPSDFEGPPGPGNPLASSLRAAREHLARVNGATGDLAAQPYPLLLVRPSGVMAYYAAREAIQSWGSEFGYQFVDEDWELDYPPADPALAAAEARAIEEARRRLAWLQQARPARQVKPTQQYRAATTRGGVVADGGPSLLGDQSRFEWTDEQAGGTPGSGAGGGFGTGGGGGTGTGPAAVGPAGPGRGVVAGDGSGSGRGDALLGAGGRGPGSGGSGSGSGGGVDGGLGDRYAGPSKFYAGADQRGGRSAGNGDRFGQSSAGSVGEGGPGGAPGDPGGGLGGEAGGGAGGTAATRGSGMDGAQPGSESGPGGSAGGSAGGSGPAGSATAAAGGQSGVAGNASGGGVAMPGLAQVGGGGGGASGGSATVSFAGKRGSNWASLATHDRPIPLTRPIRVECAAAEFRLLDDAGRVAARVPVGTHTADAIDPLVQAIHARVAGWGIAGERMYWKPVLVLSEAADGAGRRQDLERLLADSGIDTRSSTASTAVRPLPPVNRGPRPPVTR